VIRSKGFISQSSRPRDLDPATSRTARLFQRGPAQMAKKLAEEAIEVVDRCRQWQYPGVVRESADLLYNLTVLWAAAGVRPEDVVARDGAARASARNCREAAEIGCENGKGDAQVARRPIVAL